MRRFFCLIPLSFWCLLGWGQTPTLVQHVTCPNSLATGSGAEGVPISSTPDYKCPLPELSQSGNALLLGFIANDNGTPTWSVSDDQSNTWHQAATGTDTSGNIVRVYYATNIAANTHMIDLHATANTNGYVAMSISEYYNVGTLDQASCNTATNASTSITAGSITPSVSGDLLWQYAANTAPGSSSSSVSSFAAGSQANITWSLNGTDIWDGDATQAGVYNSTSAINPTFSQSGTARAWDSCSMAMQASTTGTLPSSSFRIVHMLHQQESSSGPDNFALQFPTSGNLVALSYIAGGNYITGVSSSPSNTWSATGNENTGGSQAVSQIYYAANASTSNTMRITVSQSGAMTGTTFMMYDITGAAASPFDQDSTELSGTDPSKTSLVMCTSCLSSSTPNELILANVGNAWCTSIGITAPSSGALFDTATYTGNSVSGPEAVDENNGWMHYYDPNTSAFGITWAYNCTGTANGYPVDGFAGRLAAFKGAQANNQLLPPTGLNATVN